MTESLIKELQLENQHLRDLVLSLSATLLQKVVLEPDKGCRAANSADAERLLREAEECFRCARLPGVKKEIADGLAAAGHEFLAKAVKIEAQLQRTRQGK
jgi:hypothetical protein